MVVKMVKVVNMQALKAQLEMVTQTLSKLVHTDVSAIEDAKGLKTLAFVIDRVLDLFDRESCTLQQLKLGALKKLEGKMQSVRPQLEQAEQKFMVRYQSRAVPRPIDKRVQIDFGGVNFACALYADRTSIPPLSYGAVMIRSQPMIVYRYGIDDYVSVSPCLVAESDNTHTICCGNGAQCEFNAGCRYYHDPVEWPESQHVQKFQKTAMVKKCTTFGHAPQIAEQVQQLTFDNVRTLARYCAVQALLVHLVASRNLKID